jgi:ligand-binding sensor domain-containing protein
MNFKNGPIFFLLLCLSSVVSYAQFTNTKPYPVTDNGINSKILCVAKERKGYLLVGTVNGLSRFNGTEFIPLQLPANIKTKAVTAIAEDSKGMLWIGLQNGEIAYVRNNKVEVLNAEEGHPSVAITCITDDRKGNLYFSTAGEGIYYYDRKRFYNINTDDGLSDNYVYQLLLTKAGLSAGTDRGINTINFVNGKKHVSSFTSVNGLPDNIVRSIFPASNDDVWIGMQDKGLGIFKSNKQFTSLGNWPHGQVNALIAQKKYLLAATEDKGVLYSSLADSSLSNTGFTQLSPPYTKTSNLVSDDEGNVWFSSNHQLVKTSGTQLQNIIPFTPQQFVETHTMLADRSGNIWINTTSGLIKYTLDKTNNKWQTRSYRFAVIDEKTDITSLFEDQFGNIWLGTLGRGVILLDPKTGRSRTITEDPMLVQGSVLSINGRNGRVSISSLGGAVLCTQTPSNSDISKPLSFQNFDKVTGIGSNYIYSTLIDSKDRVWFATDGKGITMMDKGKFYNYNEKNGIKSNVVYNLCEDNLGNIWFSTTGGLYKFDHHSFTNISVEQGLNDPTVTALSTDGKGNVIAVTSKGVNIIDVNTNAISYLDANQGLEELNTDLNCIAKYDGNVYFIAKQGIVQFEANYETLQPTINLESVKLFLSDVDPLKDPLFQYDENNFSFFFSGISFSHPDKIRYQYRLDGFSNEWITTKDNYINFPKLPPGKYTFRVRASLNNQFEGTKEATYTFHINKPLWLQWWFLVLLLLIVAAALYWFVKAREKRVKRWERIEKEKIQSQFETLKAQVNPHFLFNSFNTLISVIEENPESAVEYVEHLSDLYRKIVTYRDKDTISLHEEVQLINDYFFIQQKRFGNNLQLQIQVDQQQLRQYMIAPLTLQLLCENAVKHNAISADTPLIIELLIEGDELIVRNNINPKLTIEKGEGMGLQNIQKRYQLLSRKEIKIENDGKYFIVHIPLLLA